MDKSADPKARAPKADTSAPISGAPAKPIRSAKDAINAMYAESGKETLSNYLASSAKEIINSSSAPSSQKNSAASLHRGSARRQIETSRPSASGVMRVAKSEPKHIPTDATHAMDPLAQKTTPVAVPQANTAKQPNATAPPVIKTSLKLGPKKAPVVMRPHAVPTSPAKAPLNSPKSQSALARLLANRRAQAQSGATPGKVHATMSGDIISAAPKSTTTSPSDAKTAETLRIMRQAVKKTTSRHAPENIPKTVPRPKMRPPHGLVQDVIRPSAKPQPSPEQGNLPPDSVKRRFRAAPKGYTARPEVQESAYLHDEEEPSAAADKPPVEIYGLMDEEPTGKRPEMPVIEDYKPDNEPGAAKDPVNNNKYSIKGQSPLFLKSVNVEKRPLSGSIGNNTSSADGTLYHPPDNTPLPDRNVYAKKETKKSLPTKPTVIIPASRRSRAPMIFLLILTVILGAAVGAFVYLCFFQYME